MAGHDVLFVAYQSTRGLPEANAQFLRNFIRTLWSCDASIAEKLGLHSYDMARREGGYESVDLVTHSLGAVVARLALCDGVDAGEPWVRNCRLLNFAPAHNGARLLEFAQDLRRVKLLEDYFSVLEVAYRIRRPVIDMLRPGSPFLAKLEANVRSRIPLPTGQALVSPYTRFGEFEDVVVVGEFVDDATAVFFDRKGHLSVCKPTEKFLEPFEEIEALARGVMPS